MSVRPVIVLVMVLSVLTDSHNVFQLLICGLNKQTLPIIVMLPENRRITVSIFN